MFTLIVNIVSVLFSATDNSVPSHNYRADSSRSHAFGTAAEVAALFATGPADAARACLVFDSCNHQLTPGSGAIPDWISRKLLFPSTALRKKLSAARKKRIGTNNNQLILVLDATKNEEIFELYYH